MEYIPAFPSATKSVSSSTPFSSLNASIDTESRGDQSQLGTNSTPIAKKLSGSNPFTSGVQFAERPGLRDLISNLADIFSIRYRRKPSEETSKSKKVLGASFLSAADSFYEMDVATLKSDPQWLVQTLREATSNGDWPTNDRLVKQIVGSMEPGKGWKFQSDGVNYQPPC